MIQLFSAYIKTIAALLIFAVFVEMIIPENSFKKYIGIVLGLLMLFTVLGPILKLFDKGEQMFDFSFSWDYQAANKSLIPLEEQLENDENILIASLYETKLAEDVKSRVFTEQYQVSQVSVMVEKKEESGQYGKILKLDLIISPMKEKDSFIAVKPVQGFSKQPQEDANETIKKEFTDKLQQLYGIESDKVTISVQKEVSE